MAGYASVPEHIVEEIQSLNGADFRIGVSKAASMESIEAGKYKDLGVTTVDGEVEATSPLLPGKPGRWATWNLEGRDIPRPDWPRRPRSWSMTTPNFGDGARYGYSTRVRTRMITAMQTLHGKAFSFDVSATKRPDGKILLNFMLEPVFPSTIHLESSDLLMAVSLTREVVGVPRVFAANSGSNSWQDKQDFDWEFLPVDHDGKPTLDYDKVADTLGIPQGSAIRDTFKERYSTIRGMDPKAIRYGNTGFSRYVAFEFDKAVVLENYSYGNAAYVMYEDWQELSQRTRLDLLSDPSAKFERVIHTGDWKDKLQDAIKGHRKVG